jgi:UDP-2,3-diacylglucosamine pyrophosphatase LpxH
MLIVISDLHFMDESAGEHNVSPAAFKGAFNDIANYNKTMKEVKLLFLGDIFDLLRTTKWLSLPEEERPWGDTQNKGNLIKEHAVGILDDIITKNAETLALFRDELPKVFGGNFEKIYIPGNHDRLCNLYPELREKVRNTLGLPGGSEPFPHVYDDMTYGNKYKVFACHGHEYDPWNYEGTTQWSDADYSQVPIGDLIACEVAARFPFTIMANIGNAVPDDQKAHLKRNLQEVDNVRPFPSILNWVFYQITERPQLKKVINISLGQIAANLQSLQYFNRWYKRHDKLFRFDMADEVKTLIEVFKHFNVDAAEELIIIFSKIFGTRNVSSPDDSDKRLNDAATDFLKRAANYRSIVMGHTHNSLQMPVRVTNENLDQVYINTGTWRKRYVQGTAGGFVGLKYLTYATFYSEAENPRQSFDTWTGSLKEDD